MTGTKNRQKSILMICCLLAVSMLAGCGAKPTDESSNALTESNATISASELVVAGNEIAIGVDPTVYPAADYLLNMGAGEILFKADANGVIQPYFDYSGPLAHPGRSLAQLDRASAHSTRSAVQPMLAADRHTC